VGKREFLDLDSLTLGKRNSQKGRRDVLWQPYSVPPSTIRRKRSQGKKEKKKSMEDFSDGRGWACGRKKAKREVLPPRKTGVFKGGGFFFGGGGNPYGEEGKERDILEA